MAEQVETCSRCGAATSAGRSVFLAGALFCVRCALAKAKGEAERAVDTSAIESEVAALYARARLERSIE